MAKKALTVSIIIPVYNEEYHLAACLDSIAAQTVKPDEVLIVDNNSTDNSLEIAKRYDFVKIIKEKKQGVLFARNKGFNSASGDIIGRIDADTILREDWVKVCKRLFASPKVSAVTGAVFFYDMPFSPHNYLFDHGFKALINKFKGHNSFLFGTNMAIRKTAWEKIGAECCTRRDIFEDLDLAIHLQLSGLKPTYDKRLRAGMSSRRYDDSWRDFSSYLEHFEQSYKVHNIKSPGAKVANFAYKTGYFALYPLRRAYDEETKRRSLRHLMAGGTKPRKNPML